ncbi:MAG: hypothetical protein AAF196_00250 [Planctomycetota bacterium]
MTLRLLVGVFLGTAVLSGCGEEESLQPVDPQVVSGESPLEILDRCFVDPNDQGYLGLEVFRGDVVLVLSAPVLSQGELQQELSDLLMDRAEAQGFKVVFLQDLSQALFESVALSIMRERWEPDSDPLLLVDSEGEVRKAFGLNEAATLVVTLRDRVVLDRFDGSIVKDDPAIVPAAFAR